MSNSTVNVPVPQVQPAPVTPPPITPPPVPVNIVDSTKNGINATLTGTTLTITDSGVVPPPTYPFPPGTKVQTIGAVPVRSAPLAGGGAGQQIGTATAGAIGTVTGTPIKNSSGTFNWLQIQFSSGTNPANLLGYVGDDNLLADPLPLQS